MSDATATNTTAPEFEILTVLNEPRKCLVEKRKLRNSEAHATSFIPVFEPDESINEWLIRLFGSAEKVRNVIIRDIIRPAANEASSAAIDAKTGEFSELKYAEALAEYGEPASRRSSGPSKKDLTDRLVALSPELTALMGEFAANPGDFGPDSPKGMRFAKLFLEQKEITDALAAKDKVVKAPRKPRAKKAAAVSAPVATPAEITG
jgi:hypothetical protein